jgi:hypothetical protein
MLHLRGGLVALLVLATLLAAIPVQLVGAKSPSSSTFPSVVTLSPSQPNTGVSPQLALSVCQGTSDLPHKSVTIPGEVDAKARTYCPVVEYVESWFYLDGTEVDHAYDTKSRPNGTASDVVAYSCVGGNHEYTIVSLHSVYFLDGSSASGFTSQSSWITCPGPYLAE